MMRSLENDITNPKLKARSTDTNMKSINQAWTHQHNDQSNHHQARLISQSDLMTPAFNKAHVLGASYFQPRASLPDKDLYLHNYRTSDITNELPRPHATNYDGFKLHPTSSLSLSSSSASTSSSRNNSFTSPNEMSFKIGPGHVTSHPSHEQAEAMNKFSFSVSRPPILTEQHENQLVTRNNGPCFGQMFRQRHSIDSSMSSLTASYMNQVKQRYMNNTQSKSSYMNPPGSSGGIKRAKSTFPFGKCKVCNDKATGVHYGRATCEGCKGFFKRSTQRNDDYRCFFGNNCPLTPDNRNRCKACRFQKCKDVGMSVDAVKMGRIPKAEKDKALKSSGQDSENFMIDENEDESYLATSHNFDDEMSESPPTNRQHQYHYASMMNGYESSDEQSASPPADSNECRDDMSQEKTSPAFGSNKNFSHKKQILNSFESEEKSRRHVEFIESNDQAMDCMSSCETRRASESALMLSDLVKAKVLMTAQVDNYMNCLTNCDNDSSPASSTASHSSLTTRMGDINVNQLKNQKPNTSAVSTTTIDDTAFSIIDASSNISCNKENNNSDNTIEQVGRQEDTRLEIDECHANSTLFKNLNDFINKCTPFSNVNSLLIEHCLSDIYFPNMDENMLMTSSILSDRIYQIYMKHSQSIQCMYEKALETIRTNSLDRSIKTKDEIWDLLIPSLKLKVNEFVNLVNDIPGINSLTKNDLTTLSNTYLFDTYMIQHACLFINDESYSLFPGDVPYTRERMTMIIGSQMVEEMFKFTQQFNSLNLTLKEIALTLPNIFTKNAEIFIDQAKVHNLHDYFYRALLYEFDLNGRDKEFLIKYNKVLERLPYLNELYVVNIGSLIPPGLKPNDH